MADPTARTQPFSALADKLSSQINLRSTHEQCAGGKLGFQARVMGCLLERMAEDDGRRPTLRGDAPPRVGSQGRGIASLGDVAFIGGAGGTIGLPAPSSCLDTPAD